ncbi:nfx1-type zinc finger-containing protein [Fusarium heterosporum]|uniref:Nfx1-type zinc finger-containing protein n=1 Tax=Fusarium heterosporum TaxID=42747 RepID=A0A8H5U0V3_FUSHE|nr:nfx1-type zinc finger-containing protein [Fusarium heterosporum]
MSSDNMDNQDKPEINDANHSHESDSSDGQETPSESNSPSITEGIYKPTSSTNSPDGQIQSNTNDTSSIPNINGSLFIENISPGVWKMTLSAPSTEKQEDQRESEEHKEEAEEKQDEQEKDEQEEEKKEDKEEEKKEDQDEKQTEQKEEQEEKQEEEQKQHQEESPEDSAETQNERESSHDEEKDLKWTDMLIPDEDFESIVDKSPSQIEWLRQKREENQENKYLDQIMSMVGHEEVKNYFLSVKDKVDISKRWNKPLSEWSFDLLLHGLDGTGKKRIAQIYAEYLHSLGVVPSRNFAIEFHGSNEEFKTDATLVFFSNADYIDRDFEILNILTASETTDPPKPFILSYRKLESASRNAIHVNKESLRRCENYFELKNYGESEISQMVKRLCKTRPEFGDGDNPLLNVLVQKMLKRALKEKENFTNAHAVVEEIESVIERCQTRNSEAWFKWAKTHSPQEGKEYETEEYKRHNVALEDILDSKPRDFRNNKAWKEMQKLIGLKQVKEDIEHMIDLAEFNYQSQLLGKQPLPISHNRCFLGASGVGKTTIAALYAEILTGMGLLSRGHVITKRASDLIGEHIGNPEVRVTEALNEAEGGVLIIDDAHTLFTESSTGNNDSDVLRRAVIDTLVAHVSGSPGEDRCVILCGYADKMERMFLKSNPGLEMRFPLESALRFASYNDDELHQILKQKMERDGISASKEAHKVARDVLSRSRRRTNFGNGGDVETLLSQAKLRRTKRLKNSITELFDYSGYPLEAIDFDPDFDRSERAEENRDALFEDFVGFQAITDKFQKYHKMTVGMRRCGVDPKPHIPWAFVFQGPPGTGKTMTARKVGKLFYDMGFLSSDEVVTCSVTDLIGEYCGQTGPKVIRQFELGLGKVLFIDEAYRLCGDRFHNEAVGELVDAMTKPKYAHNMIVILAGYGNEMDALLSANPGLRSRFPTILDFPQITSEQCLQLLIKRLSKLNISLSTSTTELEGQHRSAILHVFTQLIGSKGWASGRDIETLSKTVIEHVFIKAGESEDFDGSEGLSVSFSDLMDCLKAMMKERGNSSPKPMNKGHELGFVMSQRRFANA